ncbi:hypothetical protein BO78DRAFT_468978 [Aspergillus sclerotiicarbonarius CBS 121057]|uniref:Phytase-like domain-containing protein n=1 Tax=Aspergillus sclerotiicarbonarius (strain CBS 121057 / IBT 28362) TaxID=1448318 RepID=A0A319EE94_ASPSB|nr:hypothetical protein BO78DRAFT_468978 [Aspergillus sclerotiicarbonarius CBS 121057]
MRLRSLVPVLPSTAVALSSSSIVNQTTCGNTTYTYTGLEGYGFVPSNATDKYGDTMGGFGSSAAFDLSTWRRTGANSYTGILYALPDRGWNTNGTLNFQPRIHTFNLTLHLAPNASASQPSPPNIHLHYLDTLLLTGPDNQPLTGLDATFNGTISYPNFPPLPMATYTGDGFGGPGPGGQRIPLDSEGLALPAHDPSHIYISDEYGPYIYKFNKHTGQMVHAIQPPPAYLPRRNSTLSFSADSPPLYDPSLTPIPADPDPGRDNNQGFEGLTISPDGRKLYTLLQSALNQEGGLKKKYRNQARLLQYDISSNNTTPIYEHEYVVTLPKYHSYTKNETLVAAQSEIHLLPTGDFLILARDSGLGHGQDHSLSVYRHADIFHISPNTTTDLKSLPGVDSPNGTIASNKGTLHPGITAAEYCPFLDYNVNSQLARFGLHNGGDQDRWLLNEKWESLALVPVDPRDNYDGTMEGKEEKEYFLFSISDNDFVTQDGYMNFGRFRYADGSGYNLDNQVLAFRIRF